MNKTFWCCDRKLAERRHLPAINYLIGFSKYPPKTDTAGTSYHLEPILEGTSELITRVKVALVEEDSLLEIVQLVGVVPFYFSTMNFASNISRNPWMTSRSSD